MKPRVEEFSLLNHFKNILINFEICRFLNHHNLYQNFRKCSLKNSLFLLCVPYNVQLNNDSSRYDLQKFYFYSKSQQMEAENTKKAEEYIAQAKKKLGGGGGGFLGGLFGYFYFPFNPLILEQLWSISTY